jgi:hypothetical protein
MLTSTSVAMANLTSVAMLVFVLGMVAARIKSDVRIPDATYQMISIFLLFGIGLKGGHSLKSVTFQSVLGPGILTLLLGIAVPCFAYYSLKWIKALSDVDRGALAAHYGSTSLVTFTAALLLLENSGIKIEGYATALLTILEIPGIIVGIFLGSTKEKSHVSWGKTFHEVLTSRTILLLVGGLLVGVITNAAGYKKVAPFFIDLQGGFLTLFLLHLGYTAGNNWDQLRRVGPSLTTFATVFPLFMGSLGVLSGHIIGMSTGGSTILGVLCASASYIAAPAAVSIGLPGANGSLALLASIGITFPFNLVVGIPTYLELAKRLGN